MVSVIASFLIDVFGLSATENTSFEELNRIVKSVSRIIHSSKKSQPLYPVSHHKAKPNTTHALLYSVRIETKKSIAVLMFLREHYGMFLHGRSQNYLVGRDR